MNEIIKIMVEINMSSAHARNHTTDFDLNSFLYKFGYLQHARANDASGSSEEEIVEFAIRTYQRNFGIGVTGKLDDETKSRMKGARCGNGDFVDCPTPINFDPKPVLQKYVDCARSHSDDGASAVQILRSAVGKYQEHYGIEATGKLDYSTLAHMKTKIPRSDGSNAGSLLTRLQNRVYDPDRAVMLTFKAISDMAERIEGVAYMFSSNQNERADFPSFLISCRLSLVKTIKDRASAIYKRLEDQRCTRGKNLEHLVAACIYIACREEGNPRTVKEICFIVAGATEREIGRAIEFVVKQLNVKEGDQSMRHFYSDLGMSNEEVRVVEETVQKAGDLDIRRSPISVAAAIVFMVTQLSETKKPLQDISMAAAIAEGTIKYAYRDLYPHAEKIIPEWYAKERDLKILSPPQTYNV